MEETINTNETQVLREFNEWISKYNQGEIKVSCEASDGTWNTIITKPNGDRQIFEYLGDGEFEYIGTTY